MSERKDVIIEPPTANIETVALAPSVTAVSKDKNGNVKAKRLGDSEGSKDYDYVGEDLEESDKITNLKSKSDQKNIDKKVVRRLLPVFNKDNSTNFVISNEEPKQYDSADVFIEDLTTKAKIPIQVTVSDAGAIARLRSKKLLSRKGNAYQLSSDAIKTRIEDKTEKYPEIERRKLVLALDGWPAVTKKILDSFRMQEEDFLEQAGWCQIWFVGDIEEEIVRLY